MHITVFWKGCDRHCCRQRNESRPYLLISQVCILGLPSFGRAVIGTAADSEIEVSAYFTSVIIPSFGRAVTDKRECGDASEKGVYT